MMPAALPQSGKQPLPFMGQRLKFYFRGAPPPLGRVRDSCLPFPCLKIVKTGSTNGCSGF